MQKSPLLEFIKDKINALPPKTEKEPPVITISREYGCPGVLVANEVTKKLSSKYNSQWSILDKQVILQAAEEFNISEEMIQEILQNKPKGVFEELFLSFSDINLPSDVQIRKTIARIIRTVALHGNVVVLGRGGVVITRDIKKSVHVHLHAPLDYRVEKVKKMNNLSSENEALGMIKKVDGERVFLRNYFAGETLDINIFDASFNCSCLNDSEVVDLILHLAEKKGI